MECKSFKMYQNFGSCFPINEVIEKLIIFIFYVCIICYLKKGKENMKKKTFALLFILLNLLTFQELFAAEALAIDKKEAAKIRKSADTDQPGMHLISKDDLWTMILLVGEKESCEIGVKWNGNLLTYGGVGAACVSMTNSSNTDIYCTPKKSICKTEKEILDFAQ